MLDVAVIENAAAAEATLDPIRARLLAELRVPASAASVAARMGLPRQKVNYHLKMLELHGLVTLVDEKRRGNVTERIMGATARSYVISPAALPEVAPDPAYEPNRLSARWMLAVAARLVKDVGTLITGADRANQRLATFALDGEITFATAADRAAFVAELAASAAQLAQKYHSGSATGGRKHRLVVALHPSVKVTAESQLKES
ncbi:Helix-turn-helix domain-containing protein [Arthrobacter alpinus]|uniref:Helix-turn-helix domain-containing protein n=1 Tax=Arthrobacter alpinus TaxID=656366 RepID=A0A1H5LB01_9MICC|nr:helix-turn-helix domain-containing protein [Arthrobacter alpinus]SEE74185.1 Helix-turn-helix domain-containing protein [Arthrobacter alpinus]